MRNVIDEIAAERKRQIEEEGWTPEHDRTHFNGDLAMAAASYAWNAGNGVSPRENNRPSFWPWRKEDWKPKSRRDDLKRAGALIVAEMERMDEERGTSDD